MPHAATILAAMVLGLLPEDPVPAGTAAVAGTDAAPLVVALQPLGEVDDEAIGLVHEAIEESYVARVVLRPARPHPRAAWYAPRRRWRADRLLDWLRRRVPDGADRIVGLTAADISIPKPPHRDWGICGYGDVDGPAAVVSTWRVKRKLGRGTRDEKAERYRRRLRGLAAHELGHTLGLPHCPTRGCTMEDAEGSVKTFDRWSGRLCDTCRARLEPVAR